MPSIPLIGGPHDGARVNASDPPETTIEFFFVPLALYNNPLADRHPRHTYRLSPCGRRYLHTSLVDQN